MLYHQHIWLEYKHITMLSDSQKALIELLAKRLVRDLLAEKMAEVRRLEEARARVPAQLELPLPSADTGSPTSITKSRRRQTQRSSD